jgi:ELWxxDGT repeat protein
LLLEALEDRRVMTTYSSLPQDYTVVGNQAYFAANDGSGFGLWKTDGTAAGTVLVQDFSGSDPYATVSSVHDLTNVGGTLCFLVDHNGTPQLWAAHGNTAQELLDFQSAGNLVNVGGTLLFAANDVSDGNELWRSDGTAIGTFRVKDIVSGAGSSDPESLVNYQGKLYFSAENSSHLRGMWTSDGTEAGTTLVTGFGPGGRVDGDLTLTPTANGLFAVRDEVDLATGLFLSDGTGAGTTLLHDFPVRDVNASLHLAQIPTQITAVGTTTYFDLISGGTNNVSLQSALWKTDGTLANTAEIKLYGTGQELQSLTNLGGTLYFSQGYQNQNSSLYLATSDGTAAGTREFVYVGSGMAAPHLTKINSTLYFAVAGDIYSSALWKSDGTSPGTHRLRSFSYSTDRPYASIGVNPNLVHLGDTLLYTADGGATGLEPWQMSLATEKSVLITDINTINGSPVIPNIGPPRTYYEGSSPTTLLGPLTSFTYTSNYRNPELDVFYQNGHGPNDRLAIRNSGTDQGEIGVSGNSVTYSGNVIGQFTGGGSQSLVVKLVPSITNDAIAALLKAITYENVNRTALADATRFFKIQVFAWHNPDNTYNTVYTIYRPLELVAHDDAPKLQGSGHPTITTTAPTRLFYDVLVTDADSKNFAGHTLTIQNSGAKPSDFLTLTDAFHFDGQNHLYRGSQIIGTRNAGGGKGQTDLIVELNDKSTAAGITEFIAALRFNARVGGTREVTASIFNGVLESNGISSTVQVFPTFAGGGTLNYTLGAPAVALFANAVLTDNHSSYGNAQLRVYFPGGRDPSDRISISGGGYSASNTFVYLNGVKIGQRVYSWINLYDNVTLEVVQGLAHNIRFSATSSHATRILSLGLRFKDSMQTNLIATTVNVT